MIAVLSVVVLSLIAQCYGAADNCNSTVCTLENGCRCASAASPLSTETTPQFITITIDESVGALAYTDNWDPLFSARTNPDGVPVKLTFFVPHEYTDYSIVNTLYVNGHEIGVGSVTKTSSQEYWRKATLQTLVNEFAGQKTILNTFANIPEEDIVGARTPQLQLEGDISIQAYMQSGLTYDSSWPTFRTAPLFPYTLDYLSSQKCDTSASGICPTESHAGFWEFPIVNLNSSTGTECNAIIACIDLDASAGQISTFLIDNLEAVRSGRRTPFTLMLSAAVFAYAEESFQAFQTFLDHVATLNDVFIVSQADVIAWMKNPVPVDQYQTPTSSREAECKPTSCPLETCEGSSRYLVTCNGCPDVYPWIGNPTGDGDLSCTTTTKATTTTAATTPSTTAEPTNPTTVITTTEAPSDEENYVKLLNKIFHIKS